jgi:hypothetical protein
MTTMVPLPGYNVEGHSKKVIDEERREPAVSAPFAKLVAPPFWAVIWSRRRAGASPTPNGRRLRNLIRGAGLLISLPWRDATGV